ncbi:MAG: response regulator transcription factor [Gammaproteobacteria bacterium]|nr:response regulator transcription factor [Gammaproteobacteria bacterium]
MRLLLVEDDDQLAEGLSQALTAEAYVVDRADNGIDAQYMAEQQEYAAVILDLGLPGRPGLEVLRNWRDKGILYPVLILTARDSWQERVDGLQAGADDYLGKPFHQQELLARLQALLRRTTSHSQPQLAIAGIQLDEIKQCIEVDGKEVDLTAMEFRLLRYLMRHAGEVIAKQRLYEAVYDWDSERDINIIEVYIRRLREKLGKEHIETRRGQGYRFRLET